MACTGCGSGGECTADLISPWMPPQGGWYLEGWPPGTPAAFVDTWHIVNGAALPKWEGNAVDSVIGSINEFLGANRIKINQSDLCQWANEQWCQRDPSRCNATRNQDSQLASQRKASYVGAPMQWATPFWKQWNVAVSDVGRNDAEAIIVMKRYIADANHLLSGNYGCSDCYNDFQKLLAKYPIERVNSWKKARVWLWRVHNETRDSGKVVPYYDIAKINGWEQLTDEELHDIIEGELRE